MFEKKTLIVVGAGASKEVNLPTGLELKQKIASMLNITFEYNNRQKSGDETICGSLIKVARLEDTNTRGLDEYLDAAWMIRDAMPQAISIDHFIDSHQGNEKLELCGKLAIVRSILEAERGSKLHFENLSSGSTLNYKALGETWFNSFMQLLTENCREEQLEERLSSIALIIFNYDRCIEHFLFHSLQTYYGIDNDRATNLVRSIQIYHPYGTVGALPWYGGEHSIAFGAKPSTTQLLELAGQIKTFTEGTDPNSSDVAEIKNTLESASIVLFLGFAFHRLNLDLIRPTRENLSTVDEVQYFGTAKGISKSDCVLIISDLTDLVGANPELIKVREDLTCCELFHEYRRSLSLA